MATITARISESLNDSLSSVANAMERPKSFLINKAIEKYMKELQEDIKDSEIALVRMKKPNGKFYSSEEIREYININCRDV